MKVQYLNLVVERARRHEDEKSMARDYGPNIKDDDLYEELREVGRARRRLQGSPTLPAWTQASEAPEEPS